MADEPVGSEQGQEFSDAAYAGNIEKLQEMLGGGFDINSPDTDGFTALHRSCVTGNIDVIKFLVDKGADVNAEDSYGDSPMHYACFCGHVDAVQALINAGADPAKPSRDGKTPLESAKEEGHDEVVRLLSVSQGGNNKVAGLDFSSGVIIEGELRKKRANRVVKWRRKYYVLSQTYGAMFFWTGTRSHVEGVIKKVRFETFLSVRHHKNEKNGRRFDIRVVTGRTMELLASNESDALHWVSTIKEHLGDIMAVIRVQAAFRTFKARKELRRLIDERKRAVKRLMATRRRSILAVGGSGASILCEGPLKKKNTKSLSRLLSKFRTRYFVLNAAEGALQYFENKTKRKLNVNPRSVPFMSLYSVTHLRDKKGKLTKAFELRIMSGRVFEFQGKDMGDTVKWVTKLLSVLPRDNVAAVKIQSIWRMYGAKKELARRREVATGQRADVEKRFGKPFPIVNKATIKIQAVGRGHIARAKHRRIRKAREEQEAAAMAKATQRKRLYLKKKGEHSGTAAKTGGSTNSRLARLHALRARKAAHSADAADTAAAGPAKGAGPPHPPAGAPPANAKRIPGTPKSGTGEDAPAAPAVPPAAATAAEDEDSDEDEGEWTELADPDTGAKYWYNALTGETTWDEPAAVKRAAEAAAAAAGAAGNDGDATTAGPWIEVVDDDSGDVYYVNTETQESSWEKPADFGKAKKNPNAPWIEAVDPDSGETYYVNEETEESSWDKPEGWVDVDADEDEASGETKADAAPQSHNGWVAVLDDDSGDTYYVHEETGQSSWEKPDGWPADDAEDAGSDDDEEEWLELTDPESGAVYYYNNKTGERRWTNPHQSEARDVASDVDSDDDDDDAADEVDSEGEELDEDKAWVEMTDPSSNETYYFNSVTQETTWSRPLALGGKRQNLYAVDTDELHAFCAFVNMLLMDDDRCADMLPLDGSATPPDGLFAAVRTGTLLARVINTIEENTIDERVIDWEATPMDRSAPSSGADGDERKQSHAADNLNLDLQSAQVLGAVLADVTSTQLEVGDPKATMDTVWQLFKVYVLRSMNVKETPSLMLLKGEDMELSELLALTPEQLLVRWAAYQLSDRGTSRHIAHLGTDLSDCVGYAHLLHAVAPEEASEAGIPSTEAEMTALDTTDLATLVSNALGAIGMGDMFLPGALTSTNTRLHLATLGMLFLYKPGMESSVGDDAGDASEAAAVDDGADVDADEEEDTFDAGAGAGAGAGGVVPAPSAKKASKKHKVTAADLEALNKQLEDIMQEEAQDNTREIRTMQLWINSLHIKGVYVNNLIRDVKDGVLTLKVLDRVEPGIVKWKKAHVKPSNKYRCMENSVLAINIGKAMDFVLLGVGPMDFYNGTRKMILTFYWQLMRYHTLKLVSSLGSDGFEVTERDILDWANERVEDAGYEDMRVRSFKDSSLKTSHFLLRLLHSVRPIVNWEVVTPGNGEEERKKNAQYVVSIARAAGATVCLSWEDIVEGNSKMIMMLVAAIMKATTAQEDEDGSDDDGGFDDDDFGDKF